MDWEFDLSMKSVEFKSLVNKIITQHISIDDQWFWTEQQKDFFLGKDFCDLIWR